MILRSDLNIIKPDIYNIKNKHETADHEKIIIKTVANDFLKLAIESVTKTLALLQCSAELLCYT